jgi:hypothetical protein
MKNFGGEHEDPDDLKRIFWMQLVRLIVHCVAVLVFTGVIAYRVFHANFSAFFHFQSFDFSQFISLILAFFSILLSAAFYFKATDTSNKFYDRTYLFMKDLGDILGRMEERFGERLQNISEATGEIRREFMRSGNENRSPVATTDAIATPRAAIATRTPEEHQ